MSGDSTLQNVARWSGFVGSFLTAVLGIFHLCNVNAKVRWPGNNGCPDKFTGDWCNQVLWRFPLFSFAPSVFVDVWTPLVFGLFGTLVHMDKFKCGKITGSFVNYLIFNVIEALWACMGYDGGLGILFSIPIWISVLFCLICAIKCDDDAFLNVEAKISRK